MHRTILALLLAALLSPLAAEVGSLRVDVWDGVTQTRLYASAGSEIDDGNNQWSLDLRRVSTTWVFVDDQVYITAPGGGYWFTAYATDFIPQTFTDVQIWNASTTKYVVYLQRPVLSLAFSPTSVSEGGTSTGTVTLRNGAGAAVTLRNAVTVNLASSATGRATVPATVTIPAGVSSATFTVTAVNNAIVDGNAAVTITATSGTWGNTNGVVTVIDND